MGIFYNFDREIMRAKSKSCFVYELLLPALIQLTLDTGQYF